MSESYIPPEPQGEPAPYGVVPPTQEPENSRIFGVAKSEPMVIPEGSDVEQFIIGLDKNSRDFMIFGSGKHVYVEVEQGRTHLFINGTLAMSTER